MLNISQFYARPGTPAAKMRRVPNGVAKARSRGLSRLFNAQRPHGARLIGRTVTVWVNTETAAAMTGSSDGGSGGGRGSGGGGGEGRAGGDNMGGAFGEEEEDCGDDTAASGGSGGGGGGGGGGGVCTVGHTKSYVKVRARWLRFLGPSDCLIGTVGRIFRLIGTYSSLNMACVL